MIISFQILENPAGNTRAPAGEKDTLARSNGHINHTLQNMKVWLM
jgi:hypothetical protein